MGRRDKRRRRQQRERKRAQLQIEQHYFPTEEELADEEKRERELDRQYMEDILLENIYEDWS